MKRWIALLFCLPLVVHAQDTISALFLGNSYTNYNNLPNLVQNLAAADGNLFTHDSNTPGGYTLEAHSSNTTTLNKIAASDWNYVILQGQSQRSSFPPAQVATEVEPYASLLNDFIKANNACTETLFYMTWGRQNGDASNCANYAPLCTYAGMQARVKSSYLLYAHDNGAAVSPVGAAWKQVRNAYPSINLYTADQSHPSLAGSYLAACVFYSSMFRVPATGNSYINTLDSVVAANLQTIASNIVLDSLDYWRIGANDISVDAGLDTIACNVDSIELEVNGEFNSLLWSNGATTNSTFVSESGDYIAVASNVHGCEVSDEVSVVINQVVSTNVYEAICDTPIIINGISFSEDSVFSVTYSTSDGCDSLVNYELIESNLGLYYVSLSLPDFIIGCKGCDSVNIIVDPDTAIVIISDNHSILGKNIFVSGNPVICFLQMEIWNSCGEYSSTTFDELAIDWFALCYNTSISSTYFKELGIQLHPNPSNGIFQLTSKSGKVVKYKIYSLVGQQLVEDRSSNTEHTIDLTNYKNGLYLLEILDENNRTLGYQKIMKN